MGEPSKIGRFREGPRQSAPTTADRDLEAFQPNQLYPLRNRSLITFNVAWRSGSWFKASRSLRFALITACSDMHADASGRLALRLPKQPAGQLSEGAPSMPWPRSRNDEVLHADPELAAYFARQCIDCNRYRLRQHHVPGSARRRGSVPDPVRDLFKARRIRNQTHASRGSAEAYHVTPTLASRVPE